MRICGKPDLYKTNIWYGDRVNKKRKLYSYIRFPSGLRSLVENTLFFTPYVKRLPPQYHCSSACSTTHIILVYTYSYRGSLSVIMPTTPMVYPSYRLFANDEDSPPTRPQTYIYIMFSRDRAMWAPGCGSDGLPALFYPSTIANVLSRTRAYIQTRARARESWERLSPCVR